jgi:hypothetical protein
VTPFGVIGVRGYRSKGGSKEKARGGVLFCLPVLISVEIPHMGDAYAPPHYKSLPLTSFFNPVPPTGFGSDLFPLEP